MVSSDYYIADNSDMENKKLEAAKNHYVSGDYSSALKLYLSLINTNTSHKLYHRIGKCYYKMNNFTQARDFFSKSVQMKTDDNPSYLYLGNIYYKNNDLKNAVYNWCCAFSYKPEDESICLNLATSYFSLNMNFQSVFYYEKYLKYANKESASYNAIKTSIDKCRDVCKESLLKSKGAISKKDIETAIIILEAGAKNYPVSYDVNYSLGNIYLSQKDYMHALVYLKQAYCADSRSLDLLEKLASVNINLGDYTSAYCAMRRILPLVINNQSEYLKTTKLIKELGSTFDKFSHLAHREWGDKYYENNNYHLALMEYENCTMLNEDSIEELNDRIQKVRLFINPENRIVQQCMQNGEKFFKNNDYKSANKYFSRIIKLSDKDSQEYKTAKSRIANV